MARFQPGEKVFMASAGVAVVREYAARDGAGKPRPLGQGDEPAFYVLEARDVVACVPFAAGDETLRPLVDPATASAMLEILRGEAPPPTLGKSLVERGRDVVHAGSPIEQARLLRELYALPTPVADALASGLAFMEKLVLGEVAEVLGTAVDELLREMRTRYPAAADVAARPR